MSLEKGLYWIALGVCALGLSNSLLRNNSAISDYARAAVYEISGRAETLVGMAQDSIRPEERVELPMARVDARLARAQAMLDCRRAQLDRLPMQMARLQAELGVAQAQHARIISLPQIPTVTVCPRTRVRVAVPAIHVEVPRMRVVKPAEDGTI